ncbi:hypothetical protein Dimus_025522 [Dionaea muscipula]
MARMRNLCFSLKQWRGMIMSSWRLNYSFLSSYYDATTDHECDLQFTVYSRMDISAIDQLPEYMEPYEEYMKVALVTSAQDMLSITSMIGMRGVGKEDFDWILTKPENIVTRSQEIAASHAHPRSLWSHGIPMTEVKNNLVTNIPLQLTVKLGDNTRADIYLLSTLLGYYHDQTRCLAIGLSYKAENPTESPPCAINQTPRHDPLKSTLDQLVLPRSHTTFFDETLHPPSRRRPASPFSPRSKPPVPRHGTH